MFRLCLVQPWLQVREDALFKLIGECETSDQQEMICDLLERFVFHDGARRERALDSMVRQFRDGWKLDPAVTQVVAMTWDNQPDSGQAILWSLKSYFAKHGWTPAKLETRAGLAVSNAVECPTIVLVDEFVGTGQTVIGRVTTLRKNIANAHATRGRGIEPHIKVAVVAAMNPAQKRIGGLDVDFFAAERLSRGISDHYSGKHLRRMCKLMLKLEYRLDPYDGDIKLPHFGYGRAEALYGSESGNTPNSVFPVFWWAKRLGGSRRNTLLHRM